jgi:hypothetical protein
MPSRTETKPTKPDPSLAALERAANQIEAPKPSADLLKSDPELYGRALLAGKMAEIMAEVGYVEKHGRNTEFGYDYATESDVAAALRPAMARRGVCMIPVVTLKGNRTVTTRKGTEMQLADVLAEVTFVDSETGAMLTVSMPGTGMDTMDKAPYKGATGAIKYALMKAFNISTGDDPERTREGEASDAIEGQTGQTKRDYEIKPNQRAVIWGRARGADIDNELLYRIIRCTTRGKAEHPDAVTKRSQLDFIVAALDHYAAHSDKDLAGIEAWETEQGLSGVPAGERPQSSAGEGSAGGSELPPADDSPENGYTPDATSGDSDDEIPF